LFNREIVVAGFPFVKLPFYRNFKDQISRMNTEPIGTITLVISENHQDPEAIGEEDAPILVEAVENYFKYLLSAAGLSDKFAITGSEWTLGCVTIILTIGTFIKFVATGGVAALGIKILKDYKDGREGLTKLLEDLKNARMWFKKKGRKKVLAATTATTPAKEEPFKIIFEQMVSTYEGLPPEQRKYWAAGQEMTVMDDKGDYRHYTVSLKREDLHEPVAKKIESKDRKEKKAHKKTLR
jgi:hypothetical protein